MTCVLIGDPDPDRFKHLRKVIENAYSLEVLQAKNFVELRNICRFRASELKMILLTKHLPFSENEPTVLEETYLQQLEGVKSGCSCGAWIGYIYEDTLPTSEYDVCLPFPHHPDQEKTFLEDLKVFFFNRRLHTITLNNADSLLKAQVSLLAQSRNLDDGKQILRRLASGFLICDLIVYRTRSGFSGAMVFRVRETKTNKEYLLKLSREQWKLKEETKRHPIVVAGIPKLREYKAELLEPKPQAQSDGQVVRCGDWYAICLGFLGGMQFGEMIDLQEALVGLPAKVGSNPLVAVAEDIDRYRMTHLQTVLEWLKHEWGMNSSHATREMKQPWSSTDVPEREYPPIPPYRLTKRIKNWILEFLESSEAQIGRRLTSDWDELASAIRRFIECDQSYGTAKLDQQMSMILSPSHGDLNANNVLLFLDLKDPIFLIDFPMYQQRGHALQDFARLETEVKYALMDRQLDTPATELAGFDLTPTQFQLWRELESHLHGSNWRDIKSMSSNGFHNNVNLSLRLVQSIRRAAEVVQMQYLDNGTLTGFDDEYLYPLLYHTLQSITYLSLSPYKRLLAVYSSAKLLQKAEFIIEKRNAATK